MMHTRKLQFTNAYGQNLAVYLDTPVNRYPRAYAIFAHCFTCTKSHRAISHVSRVLAKQAIAVLRFDFTGLGGSEGDFADTNFSPNVADIIAASQFLEKEYQAPALLIGHSLGGAAMLEAATQIVSCKAVVAINAPSDPGNVLTHFENISEKLVMQGEAQITIAGQQFTIKKQFLEDLNQARLLESVKQLDRALLILHSPLDQTVGVEHAARIYAAAQHPKSFVSLDQADHLLSKDEDAHYVADIISVWCAKYIGGYKDQKKTPVYSDGATMVRIGKELYYTEIVANGHALIADEPESVGGGNLGPNPYDLLMSSLGACTAMTLRMYANHKGWLLDEVDVQLRHEKTHANDCQGCVEGQTKVDKIEREIELIGELTEDQRSHLLEIANKCPVHKSLREHVIVETRLK